MATRPRISDAIKQDHRELESIYDRIVKSEDKDEQTRFRNLFTWELARHFVGEELVVFPALEKNVQGGVSIADKDRQEHQNVKEQLKKFQSLKASDLGFIPTIHGLMMDLSKNIKQEETGDLVKLENSISQEESETLSKSFSRTKIFVPTRSHPGAPDKPPFETAIGLLTAPIDQLGDLFRKWPQHA